MDFVRSHLGKMKLWLVEHFWLTGQSFIFSKWLFTKSIFWALVFCRNNGWIMENMDQGLTVPKWVLIVWPKIPPNAPEFICPSPKVQDFNEKMLHWASVLRDRQQQKKKVLSLCIIAFAVHLQKEFMCSTYVFF